MFKPNMKKKKTRTPPTLVLSVSFWNYVSWVEFILVWVEGESIRIMLQGTIMQQFTVAYPSYIQTSCTGHAEHCCCSSAGCTLQGAWGVHAIRLFQALILPWLLFATYPRQLVLDIDCSTLFTVVVMCTLWNARDAKAFRYPTSRR